MSKRTHANLGSGAGSGTRAPGRSIRASRRLRGVSGASCWARGLVTATLLVVGGALVAGGALADAKMPRTERPASAKLYFISPGDGAVVTSPVTVRFGLKGMGVAPAGVDKPDTGHHHLIVDAELPPSNLPVPTSDHYIHFGKGQTETTLELGPGQHTLQLILGDRNHVPFDPPLVSKRITITVEE